MLCKNCSGNVKSDYKFCPYCGDRVISDFHDQLSDLTSSYVIRGQDIAQSYVLESEEIVPEFEVIETPIVQEEQAEKKPNYYVYQPQPEKTDTTTKQLNFEPGFKIKKEDSQKDKTNGIGFKLFLISVLIISAVCLTYIGFEMTTNPQFFEQLGISSLFV